MAFIDFVLTRIYAARLTAEPARKDETPEHDLQWGRRMELQLVPKPGIKYPKAIEMEYSMTEGMLKLRVPAALAGYVLRRMNVDDETIGSLDMPCASTHRIVNFTETAAYLASRPKEQQKGIASRR